jgi:head-tail adaptor
MSTRNKLLIFERKASPLDHFVEGTPEWEEVCKAWASLEPVALFAQGGEFVDASQTKSQRKSIAKLDCTATTLQITTDCRAKLRKPIPVDESDTEADVNFRISQIDQIVNVKEQNRNLEMLVVERT